MPELIRPIATALLVSTLPILGATHAVAAPCSDLDMVVATFATHGTSVYMIPAERLQLVAHDAEELTGARYAGVTRGFLVRGKETIVLGFEIAGCLIDPITLKAPPQYMAEIGAA